MTSAFAPGRVNLIGEHTDYSGGLVLPVAIQYGVSVDIRGEAAEISLSSERAGAAPPFSADGSGAQAEGWARYAQAVAIELDLLGRPSVGLSGTVRSDLPTGAGLSSSAALEVSVALALCTVAEFELEPFALALACQRAELRAVGVPCGILDQAASVLGRAGQAILLDCGTLEFRFVPVPAQAALVVVDSAVSHSHESSGYADRRRELEHALRLVGVERSTEVDLADLDSLDSLSQKRLRHVVTENRRVLDFAKALERGDLAAAGTLLLAGHASLRDDYEVSIPEIDLLVELACDAGAYGARLLGGGFGGSVIALADTDRAEEIATAVAESYRARTGRAGASLVARASAGARVEQVSDTFGV
jgi:galactokinase